jgi:uncharacterized protein (TIGR03083 family)
VELTAYLASIEAAGTALAGAADGHLDDKVPTCPEWDVARLVSHVGRVHAWVAQILAAAGAPPDAPRPQAPEERSQLLPWYGEVRSQLLADLARHGADDPAWVFVPSSPQRVRWWYRRQALETAVHRYDAELAAGLAAPLDAALASEGVDELLTELLPAGMAGDSLGGLTGTLHVHATDTDGEWSLDFGAAGLAPRREHAKADSALRGPASGLYLFLMNRQTVGEAGIEVFGDGAVVDAWRAVRF